MKKKKLPKAIRGRTPDDLRQEAPMAAMTLPTDGGAAVPLLAHPGDLLEVTTPRRVASAPSAGARMPTELNAVVVDLSFGDRLGVDRRRQEILVGP